MHALMHRKVSLHHSDVNRYEDKSVQTVLEGGLDNLPPLSTKLVRVFISSTFSDMIQERNALMEHVYYKLKSYCVEKYRLEFQLIDLRWGLREESQDDHTIIEFCIKEIENCKRLSIGPNFVALLGQKYGFRSFPSSIEASKFEMMRDALLSKGNDVTMLMTWFKKDTNIIPNVYVLQPISSILKNFNKGDFKLQEHARQQWDKIFLELQHILRLGVLICEEQGRMSLKDKDMFFISVTEYEIEKGMLESFNPRNSSLCFTRNITNLEENLKNKKAKKFIDIKEEPDVVDVNAQQMLLNLKYGKISPLLEKTQNMDHFEITWEDPENRNPNEDEDYLDRFCSAFENKMKMLIDKATITMKNISRNSQIIEIHQHLHMCKIRSQVFKGRDMIIRKLRFYLASPSCYPLIIHGLSGSGKTSVLAKCASLIKFWFPHKNPTVIIRFLGTTSHSCSIRLVLYNLCWHICQILNKDPSNIPGEYSSLVKYFHESIQSVKHNKSIVIILDSIDQLSQTHKAHNLAWLPKSLPSNVHLILSTLSYEHDLLENLKVLYEGKSTFIEIEQLGTDLGISLIQEWMKSAKRDLTDQQFFVVNEALSKCSLPLYTRLVFEEICRWNSFMPLELTTLKPSVKEIINKLFDNIEKYHGKVFVMHTLSYLTASKNGLSDVELEDVLSLDDLVLNDVFEHWLPPVRRIPPLLIPRLHDALSSYLMEREANGITVYYWYHRQFIFVAKDRYFDNISHKYYIHSTLAHYFQGTWGGGTQKPYKCTENIQKLMSTKRKEADQADRKVPLQPLWYSFENSSRNKVSYNLRKLSELPYHLIESRRFIDLHSDVLFNYNWLHSKLSAMSLHDVLSDFRSAIESGDKDSEVPLVFNALRLGGSYVNSNPNTLAFDLLGRLLVYYDDHHLGIRFLLQQCDEKSRGHSALLPLHQCFDPPRSMLLYILEDHSQLVVDLVFTPQELISISCDGTLAFWDTCSGECIRTIANTELPFGHNTKLYTTVDFKYLIVDCDTTNSPIFIYDLKTCQRLHVAGRRLATQRRGFIAGNILCRQKNFIDIRTGQILKSLDDFVQSKRYVVCNITPNQRYLIIGDDFISKLFDFETCALITTFPASKMPSTIVITENSLYAYVGYMEDCLFKVWDLDPMSKSFGKVLNEFNYKSLTSHRFLEGARQNCALNEIAISPIDQSVIVLNLKRCNLILYHTKLECDPVPFDMKAIHPTNQTCLSNVTFNYNAVLVLASDKNYIHIWDVKTKLVLNSITLHSSQGFPWVVSKNNLVATASNIHTAINVWDLSKVHLKETVNIVVYEGPVDMITCASKVRLAYVRKIVTTNKTYKYIDSFGIDVWNISTGSKETFLNFDCYGKLEKFEVSPSGNMITLLVCSKETYVVVHNLKTNKVMCVIEKAFCKSFVISYNWEFICIYCIEDGVDCTYLFRVKDGREIFKCQDAKGAIFTMDDKYLLYIDRSQKILVYCFAKMAPIRFISCDPVSILPIPVKHRHILINKSCQAEVWDFHENKIVTKLNYCSNCGIIDISRNGKYGVDGSLQIYDLESGDIISQFSDETGGKEINLVTFVNNGEYVVWIDELSVKVGCIQNQLLVANTCTHERPVSLKLLDRGYTMLLGREDGRFLMMKLVIHMDHFRPISSASRAEFLLDCEIGGTEDLDVLYNFEPMSVKDCDLPKVTDSLRSLMLHKSKKPHLISSISQSSLPTTRHKRACSSANVIPAELKDLQVASKHITNEPVNNFLLNVRKAASSTSSADVCMDNQDSSDESLLGGIASFAFSQRSKSMQDILSVNSDRSLNQSFDNLESPALPTSPRKSKGKIQTFFGKFGTQRRKPKGLPHISSALTASRENL